MEKLNEREGSKEKLTAIITLIGSLIVLIVAIIVGLFLEENTVHKPSEKPTETHKSSTTDATTDDEFVKLGTEGRLYTKERDTTWVAIDEIAMEKLFKALRARDRAGVAELMLSGRVFIVKNNTKVRIIDRKYGYRKVRIEEGEKLGMSGWVFTEWIK